MRKKKRTSGKDCIAVRTLFESVHLNPEYLINYLDKRTKYDQMLIDSMRKESIKYPELEQQAIQMELENTTAQMLISILQIGMMEGKISKHVNPSLN